MCALAQQRAPGRACSLDSCAQLHRLDEAVADFTSAIELDPASASSFNSRALVLDKMEQPEGAVRDFTRAIELDPRNPIFRHNRGFCLRSMCVRAPCRRSCPRTFAAAGG